MSGMYLPKISVITVSYNCEKLIECTIKSVISQTYPNFEYIIIDGQSTDRTVDIIKKYSKKISYWVSESDKGIYDAMNKGISITQGDWIIFMNAGDAFYTDDTIQQVFQRDISQQADMIYGHCNIVYPNKSQRIQRAEHSKDLWKGMAFCHQSLFASSAWMKKYRFNCNNRIGADFEFIYQAYLADARFVMVNTIVSSVLAGGLSDIDRVESIRSHWKTVDKYGCENSSWKVKLYYAGMIVDAWLRLRMKSFLPKIIQNLVLRMKTCGKI